MDVVTPIEGCDKHNLEDTTHLPGDTLLLVADGHCIRHGVKLKNQSALPYMRPDDIAIAEAWLPLAMLRSSDLISNALKRGELCISITMNQLPCGLEAVSHSHSLTRQHGS